MSLQLDPTNGITLPDGSTLPRFLSAVTTAGTSTAYTVTPAVALTTYTNQMIFLRFHTSAGQSPTMNISALGAQNLKYIDGTGTKQFVTGLQVPTNWSAWVYYDGTDLVVLNVSGTQSSAGTQKAFFAYGSTTVDLSISNLVSSQGVVASDVTVAGTARTASAAGGYGTDKAIIGYGYQLIAPNYPDVSITNKVSNLGVIAADTTGVGTARESPACTTYGVDKAIFGYGAYGLVTVTYVSLTNLVSNQGVVATDTTGVGSARYALGAASYGTDKAVFGYGTSGPTAPYIYYNTINLVTNQGVVASDSTGAGTPRATIATSYGVDKAIFGYGYAYPNNLSMTNLVSNQGVVSADVTGVGTARSVPSAAPYGGDKAIFGYGYTTVYINTTNLVSNQGVVSADVTGVGTARSDLAAAGFSLTA